MILWLVQQLLLFRKFVQAKDTPRQLAWGLALGMLIGLVPKGNLLAVGLSMVLLGTRANLAVGMISALAFSLIGMFLDPLTDPLGLAVLNHTSLRPTWLRLYQLPLVPWTSLNNSVVMGSLILGLTLLYPSYRFSFPLFQTYLAWRDRTKPVGTAESDAAVDAAVETPAEAVVVADVPAAVVTDTALEAAPGPLLEAAADLSSQALAEVSAEALLEPSSDTEDAAKSVEPGTTSSLDRPRRRLVGREANRVNA